MLLNCKKNFQEKLTIELSQKAYKQSGISLIWAIVKQKMKSPTEEEFEESIKELSEYKNRLEKEVVTISQKLKMPQRKIESIINSHQELNKIKIILSKLYKQKENAKSNLLLWFYFCCLNNIKMYPMNVAKLNSIKCI